MSKNKISKQDFLERCSTAYDMGLFDPDVLSLASRWLDALMRYEGGQQRAWQQFLEAEALRTDYFRSDLTLANDTKAYNAIQLLAVLNHPCQKCATDPKAWHTRPAFCQHRVKNN